MTREEKLQSHKDMMKLILKDEKNWANEIEDTINDFYEKKMQKWKQLTNDIIDIMYNSLKETYKTTIIEGSKIYPDISDDIPEDITNEEIDKYTYDKDDTTLPERIKKYIVMASKEEIPRSTLIYREKKILENETKIVSHKLLRKRLEEIKIEYGMVIPGRGCDRECCNESVEEWMPIDEIDDPPYHPSCTCEVIYGDPEDDDEEL